MNEKSRVNSEKCKFRKFSGITLISLVITIIVLIILASVGIYLSLGNNGIFTRAKQAKEATNKQQATEIINLKITTAQMNKYAEKQEMPTLKELSLVLKDDNEIEYVTEDRKVASEKYNVPSENPNSIYTKLNKYPYEFEINGRLQLASINGVKIANSGDIPEGYIKPTGTKSIIKNGEYDVSTYEKVNVNVPTPEKDGEGTFWKEDHFTFSTTSNSMKYTCGFKPRIMLLQTKLTDGEHFSFYSYDSCKTVYTIDHNLGIFGIDSKEINFSTVDDGIEFKEWTNPFKGCTIDIYVMK